MISLAPKKLSGGFMKTETQINLRATGDEVNALQAALSVLDQICDLVQQESPEQDECWACNHCPCHIPQDTCTYCHLKTVLEAIHID